MSALVSKSSPRLAYGFLIIAMVLFCGCEAGSTNNSGGSFAGSGGSGGSFSQGCDTHANCGPALVCISRACLSAFPRTYIFTIRSARIARYKSTGKSWDGFGGAPDPKVTLKVDGKVICTTSVAQNTFDPQWNETCEVELFQTSGVVFYVSDSDVSVDDPIAAMSAGTPLKDSIIKAGGLQLSAITQSLEAFRVDVSLK